MICIWLYLLEINCLLYTLPTNDVPDNVRQNSKTWWFPITQVRIIARSSIVIMHPRKTIIHWSVTINTGYRTLSYVNKILIRPLIYLPMWLLDCWINESYSSDAIPFQTFFLEVYFGTISYYGKVAFILKFTNYAHIKHM